MVGPRVHVLGMNWNSPKHAIPSTSYRDSKTGAHSGVIESQMMAALIERHGKRLVIHHAATKNYHDQVPAEHGGGVWELGLACGSWYPRWLQVCRWPPPSIGPFVLGLGALGILTAALVVVLRVRGWRLPRGGRLLTFALLPVVQPAAGANATHRGRFSAADRDMAAAVGRRGMLVPPAGRRAPGFVNASAFDDLGFVIVADVFTSAEIDAIRAQVRDA